MEENLITICVIVLHPKAENATLQYIILSVIKDCQPKGLTAFHFHALFMYQKKENHKLVAFCFKRFAPAIPGRVISLGERI